MRDILEIAIADEIEARDYYRHAADVAADLHTRQILMDAVQFGQLLDRQVEILVRVTLPVFRRQQVLLQLELERQRLSFTQHFRFDFAPHAVAPDLTVHVLNVLGTLASDRFAVELHENVALPQAGPLSGMARVDQRDQGAPAALYAFLFLYLSVAGPGPLSVDAARSRGGEG